MKEKFNTLCYSVADLVSVLQVSRPTAYLLAKEPGFPSIRVGNRILIPAKELEKWLENKSRE